MKTRPPTRGAMTNENGMEVISTGLSVVERRYGIELGAHLFDIYQAKQGQPWNRDHRIVGTAGRQAERTRRSTTQERPAS